MSSAETEAKKSVKPRPVARYFGAIQKDDSKDTQHIPVDIKKKTKPFKGDVIEVGTKAKPFGKTKWISQKRAQQQNKHYKNRKNLNITVDPYALQRHSRKSSDFL